MSSDYGSDIPSDDLVAIDTAQPGALANVAPAATPPRQPLRTRDVNALATPPSSHSRKGIQPVCQSSGPLIKGSHIQDRTNLAHHATISGLRTPQARTQQHGARHDAPASSQPLPTPSSATIIPCSSHPPPSSQPTPSKRPTEVRRQPCDPKHSSTPPVLLPRDSRAPLYRFPFGIHSGKTLLEVPENYIAYLRINEDMADSMPGLRAALSLYDAGQPPVALPPAPKPTSSSQPVIMREPSPSPLATPSASQPAMMPPSKSSKPPDGPYRFDFGKHAGKTLDEVPEDYIDFLKQKGIVESRPQLAVAVIKHEREHHKTTQISSQGSGSEKYRLKFGKHVGQTLEDVPATYVTWLKTSNMYLEDPALRRAVYLHERLNVDTPKTSSKRKRSSKPSSTWSELSSGRSYAPRRRLYY